MSEQITNKIPYFIEEYKKAQTLLQDLEKAYEDKPKSFRYISLKKTYKGKVARYAKQLKDVGKFGNIIKVIAVEEHKVKVRGSTHKIHKTNVVLYFTNVSEEDVNRILKRDYRELNILNVFIIIPGQTYDRE